MDVQFGLHQLGEVSPFTRHGALIGQTLAMGRQVRVSSFGVESAFVAHWVRLKHVEPRTTLGRSAGRFGLAVGCLGTHRNDQRFSCNTRSATRCSRACFVTWSSRFNYCVRYSTEWAYSSRVRATPVDRPPCVHGSVRRHSIASRDAHFTRSLLLPWPYADLELHSSLY